ncbi:MAG: cytochrome d ubiquinol oxidase subunit II [Nevskia sp.]
MDLNLICAAVIAFGVLLYVILDGFDLGVGILFPWLPDAAARDTAIASIAPVWDGNETWLILGGAVLFAAFPGAYAVVLPAFYLPLMLMMFALIFRGVAFEFRQKAQAWRWLWDFAFTAGSTTAGFSQGLLLGGLIEGVKVEPAAHGLAFSGTPWDWLTPFAVVCGLGVLGGYALLASTWLLNKTEGSLRDWARRAALRLLLLTLAFIAAVSIYTPLAYPQIAEHWFAQQHWIALAPVPIATAVVAFSLWRELRGGSDLMPFLYAIVLFLLGYLGIAISLWPNLVPPSITIWNSAAPRASQQFLLVALAGALPMVLIYTGYAYWVFRGKVSHHGYEH